MRVKSNDDRCSACLVSRADYTPKQGAVSHVNPVKVADRHGACMKGFMQFREISNNSHWLVQIHFQPVVSQPHVWGQLGVCFIMSQLMSDVGEIGTGWFEALDQTQRILDG